MFGITVASMKLVTTAWVIGIMYELQPSAPWVHSYAETADAIASASNSDPLFKDDDGAVKTASILIALALHESHFQPNAIGDHGKSFGLFQIQPPTAHVDASLLLLPRNAALIAIDLIRTSMQKMCANRPYAERLAWYAAGGPVCSTHHKATEASSTVLHIAKKIVDKHSMLLLAENKD
jgi:hypothetical protein